MEGGGKSPRRGALRYLVTGGCGFIGSHLVDALTAAGHEIVVLDDLSTGKRENLNAKAELIVGNVADAGAVSGAVGGVDGCFHLAAIASVERGREEWLATHRVNLGGTVALLDAARRARRGKPLPLVYASSAAVYGDSDALPLAETSAALPISAYGADKLGSELHARVGGRVHGLPTAGLRFFNIYGPRQDPRSPYSGVISIFCDRLRQGQPITIFGDGKQERDFVFVADAVQALLAAMAQASIAAPVWNVCSGRAISVLGLAETIARLCGTPLEIAFAPPRAGDIKRSLGDGTAIEKALGWRPQVTLEEGLRRTLDFLSLSP